VQGFVNPHGFAGKGSWGKGRGHGFRTLTKPLPSTWVGGYPQLFGRVRVVDHSNFSQPGVEERKFNSKRRKLVVYPNKKWEEGEERKGTKER